MSVYTVSVFVFLLVQLVQTVYISDNDRSPSFANCIVSTITLTVSFIVRIPERMKLFLFLFWLVYTCSASNVPTYSPTKYNPNEASPRTLYVSASNGCDTGYCQSSSFEFAVYCELEEFQELSCCASIPIPSPTTAPTSCVGWKVTGVDPDCDGEYIYMGLDQNGNDYYKSNSNNRYLYFHPFYNDWNIGDELEGTISRCWCPQSDITDCLGEKTWNLDLNTFVNGVLEVACG